MLRAIVCSYVRKWYMSNKKYANSWPLIVSFFMHFSFLFIPIFVEQWNFSLFSLRAKKTNNNKREIVSYSAAKCVCVWGIISGLRKRSFVRNVVTNTEKKKTKQKCPQWKSVLKSVSNNRSVFFLLFCLFCFIYTLRCVGCWYWNSAKRGPVVVAFDSRRESCGQQQLSSCRHVVDTIIVFNSPLSFSMRSHMPVIIVWRCLLPCWSKKW